MSGLGKAAKCPRLLALVAFLALGGTAVADQIQIQVFDDGVLVANFTSAGTSLSEGTSLAPVVTPHFRIDNITATATKNTAPVDNEMDLSDAKIKPRYASGTHSLKIVATFNDFTDPLGKATIGLSAATNFADGPNQTIGQFTAIGTVDGAGTLTFGPANMTTVGTTGSLSNTQNTTGTLTSSPFTITDTLNYGSLVANGTITSGGVNVTESTVPEPASMALLATGAFSLGLIGWRRLRAR